MTEAALASDLVYSVMVDPASDSRAARHVALTPVLIALPEAAEPVPTQRDPETLSKAEKRTILRAGIRARGEQPRVPAAAS